MWIVIEQKIFEAKAVNAFHSGIKVYLGQRAARARKLLASLIHVVRIKMKIAKGVNEFHGLQTANLRDHHRQKGIGRDIERDAEKQVSAALI